MTATLEGIRDQVISLITAISPTIVPGTKFRHSLDEGDGDFRKAMESASTGAFRRFQVRDTGGDDIPAVSNVSQSQLTANMRILVAYPMNERTGGEGSRDRDDAIDSDWRKINYAIGIYGRANFSGANDCTPTGCKKSIEHGTACDFLVIEWTGLYLLDVTA